MKESTVEEYFNARIAEYGGETRKLKWIGRNHAPDRMPLVAGHPPTLVELKAPGKKPRPGQVREHDRLRKAGYRVLVIDTKGQVDFHYPSPSEIHPWEDIGPHDHLALIGLTIVAQRHLPNGRRQYLVRTEEGASRPREWRNADLIYADECF